MTIIEEAYKWAHGLSRRAVTTHLILHHAAAVTATPQQIHQIHLGNGWASIAYHFYVRKDGSIYRGRPIDMQGGHTQGWNWCAIGVCFEGNFETEQMPEAQKQAGRALVQYIRSLYPGIIVGGHRDFNATACPGANFPMDFITSESEELDMTKDELLSVAGTGDKPSAWAAEATDKMKQLGIFNGDGQGNYGWQQPITREAVAVVLANFAEKMGL